MPTYEPPTYAGWIGLGSVAHQAVEGWTDVTYRVVNRATSAPYCETARDPVHFINPFGHYYGLVDDKEIEALSELWREASSPAWHHGIHHQAGYLPKSINL